MENRDGNWGDEIGEEVEEEHLPDHSFEEDGGEAYQEVLKVLARRQQRGSEEVEEAQRWILDDLEDLEEEDDSEAGGD